MRIRRGFTLIELLVVIAIIAILAAILFPVFMRARENGRRTVCISNFRSIHQALTTYADDNYGYMPREPNPVIDNTWTYQHQGFGWLWKYASKGDIFRCPNSSEKKKGGNWVTPREPTYTIYYPNYNGPTTRSFKGSYHFWPHLYATEWGKPGRITANYRDRSLLLYKSFSPAATKRCEELGGPLADNFLHDINASGTNHEGVLCLNIRGTVKFMPADAYPFY